MMHTLEFNHRSSLWDKFCCAKYKKMDMRVDKLVAEVRFGILEESGKDPVNGQRLFSNINRQTTHHCPKS